MARRAGVSAVVVAGGDRPGGRAETGGGISGDRRQSQRRSRTGPREEEARRSPREQAGPVERSGEGRRMI